MTGDTESGAGLRPRAWRIAAVRAIAALPAPLRRRIWSARRAMARARRRLEARGDFSRSRPALYGMDTRLEAILDKSWGFFVEAGANDGYQQSNTYSLERIRGWRGVLVEPVPDLHREAVRERPGARVFNCALVAADYPDPEVTLHYGGLMTVVGGGRGSDPADREWVAAAHAVAQEEPEHEFSVPARTLSSLLDEAGAPEIDLLSLDVEGYEPQVLRGLDLERHAPRYILVEIRDVGSDRAGVEAVLGKRYAEIEQLSPYDVLYARADVEPAGPAA
jgi:FkbM family methyltransferase